MEEQKRQLNLKKYITFLVISFAIIAYVIYTIYRLIASPTDTFIVENGKLSSEENANAYIIREEDVLKGENYKNGIYQIKSEGEKVANGEAIFRYYTSGEDELKEKIKELDIKIGEAWENENSIFSSDIKLLEGQIEEKLDGLLHLNDLQKINEYKKDIDLYITKKAKIAGEKSPAGSYLKQLIDERSNYENELNQGSEYLNADTSGVVSYRVDGFEEILVTSDFGYLSKSMLEGLNIKTGQVVATSEESAKIVNNFYCYIACVLEHKNLEEKECKIGSKLTMRLPNSEEVNAEIIYMSKESEEEDLVVFKIEKYVEDLINYRKISIDIIWWNETGLRVPNEAIKKENEDLYYVIRKRVGYTDKIYVKILKQGEKYSIIDNYEDGQELLDKGVDKDEVKSRRKISLYDEIVI
ncbi:MAG: hypothetical protein J6M60_03085 [Clostridia bacterium]|nr:hypothetical protein [Clostridia bacterium]